MRYRLTAPHYLGLKGQQQYYPEGAEVEWRGHPSSNMEALDDEARAQIAKYKPRGFDINVMAPMPPPRSVDKPQDEAAELYPADPVKQRAMRERMAKVREARAAKAAEPGAAEG